jgi:membrane protease YdiL (CAAX protease family)
MNTFYQLSILAVSYILLFLLCFFAWKMKSENLLSPKVQTGNWTLLHIRHAGGIVIMVFIPLFFLPGIVHGLLIWPQNIDHIQVMLLMVTGLILLILSAKAVDKVENKIIVTAQWSSVHAVLHMVLRNSFLVSYEWFFRGLVLFSCVSLFGIIPAVLINLFLYALIHAFNGKKELLGSIPFGIILCAFTLWWHSVWPAVLLHLLLSSSYESVLLHQFFCKPVKIKL